MLFARLHGRTHSRVGGNPGCRAGFKTTFG
jgi:hypothetical protein